MRSIKLAFFAFLVAPLIVLLTFSVSPTPVRADEVCRTGSASQAIDAARKALDSTDTDSQRVALTCVIEAMTLLQSRLDDLVAGKVEFTGDIVAPAFLHSAKPEKSGR